MEQAEVTLGGDKERALWRDRGVEHQVGHCPARGRQRRLHEAAVRLRREHRRCALPRVLASEAYVSVSSRGKNHSDSAAAAMGRGGV